MMKKITTVAFIFTLVVFGFSGISLAAENYTLQNIESLSEDIIDYVLENNTAKITETMGEIEKAIPQIFDKYAVSSEKQQKIQDNFNQMKTLVESNDLNAFIISDNQLFAQLVDLMYEKEPSQVVPKAVIELDYWGRELQFQSRANNWEVVQRATEQALDKWKLLEPQIAEKGLQNLLNSTFAGLPEVVQNKNAEELFYRGQLILDEVDLLEDYFKNSQSENGVVDINQNQTDSIKDSNNGKMEDNNEGWFKDNDEKENGTENNKSESEEEEWSLILGGGIGGLLAGLVIGKYKIILSAIKKRQSGSIENDNK